MGRRAKKRRRKTLLCLLFAGLVLRAVGQFVVAHPVAAVVTGALLASSVLLALLARWWMRRRAWQEQLEQSAMAELYGAMDPAEFENALAVLCARDGCADVEVTGRSGDLGADVIACSPSGAKIVLQAKRYVSPNKVTGPDLQRFGGTCFTVHRADVAAVITTSTFTKAAREYAQMAGIRLLDATALAQWTRRTGPPPWHSAPTHHPAA